MRSGATTSTSSPTPTIARSCAEIFDETIAAFPDEPVPAGAAGGRGGPAGGEGRAPSPPGRATVTLMRGGRGQDRVRHGRRERDRARHGDGVRRRRDERRDRRPPPRSHRDRAASALGGSERVHAIELDVTDRDGFARAADEAESVFGNVHVLCNNAGMGILGPVAARTLRRLGLGPRRADRRRRQRDPDLPAADARARRGRAHRQHLVDGRRAPDPRRRDLHHRQGGVDRALRGAPQRARRTRGSASRRSVPGRCRRTSARAAGRGPSGTPTPATRSSSGSSRSAPNSPLWMDPVECGERVLAGIRHDDLYIFTHREFREGAEERFRAMLASFPDEPRDDGARGRDRLPALQPDLPRACWSAERLGLTTASSRA